MSSVTTNRPAAAQARSTRFGDFPGRHNSDDRTPQSSNVGQTFGNGGTWQPSSGIWGSTTIGSGLGGNGKRDASRSRGNEDYLDNPTGSGVLADTSDPWIARASGPWHPDTTSPTLQSSHSGSTSPSHVRSAGAAHSLSELQNMYSQSRPSLGPQDSFRRSQPKSNLDPSSGAFYVQKPKFGYADDKENMGHGTEASYDIDMPSRSYRRDPSNHQNTSYLEINTSASRDPSMPPSRNSEAGLNPGGLPFRNPSMSSFGHASNSSIHSQRPSISGQSGSYPNHVNGARYLDQSEAELREKFSGFSLGEADSSTSQVSYSPSQTNFPQGFQVNGDSVMYLSNFGKNPAHFENFANQPFGEQAYFNNRPRFERASVSPAGSDYRRGLNSPKFYSTAGTPPADLFRPNSRGPRMQQDPAEVNRKLQTIQYAQHQNYFHHFPGQYPPPQFEYAQSYRQAAVPYGYVPVQLPTFPTSQTIPTRPAKDQDVGVGVRSVLLEEFRSNSKSNKRYELKDIYHHVVEFSGDQHGSRFIQQKLETANSDEKEQLFREIQPNALQLMTDVFGNYVIQKLFEHGNQVQKRVLAEQMKNHVMELSMQMYGCRVVQKALEHVLADQQAELVVELQADVMKCIKDQNGNHVVQKAIERVPSEHIQFVIEAFRGQVGQLATHPYGCRVIQRILEYCKPQDQTMILEELHLCANTLIIGQYGNYVTQHVIQHGKPEDRTKVIKIVQGQLLTLSKHKFASNVVEKSIQYGTEEQRKSIVSQLTALHEDGSSPLLLMMKDQYGNYVIQKLLGQLKGAERDVFVEDMKPHLISLKKYNFGKQIAAIEKLIFTGPPTYNMTPASVIPSTTQTMPIEIGSSAPTPLMTNGENSPESSSLPSEVDDSTETTATKNSKSVDEKHCPEVVINGA